MFHKMSDNSEKRVHIDGTPLRLDRLKLITGQNEVLMQKLKYAKAIYKEDYIYESREGDFLTGESRKVVLMNKLEILTNSSRTYAKYISPSNTVTETSSDNVARLIGQKNYDKVFSALCSVIDQEAKIKGMLALLTANKSYTTSSCQTSEPFDRTICSINSVKVDSSSQTCLDETCMDIKEPSHRRRRVKRNLVPYVVKDNPNAVRKIIINPKSLKKKEEDSGFSDSSQTSEIKVTDARFCQNTLPDLKGVLDEDSKDSLGNISLSSICSLDLVENETKTLLTHIENHTGSTEVKVSAKPDEEKHTIQPTVITVMDGSQIMVCVKPEDKFHLATPEILKNVTHDERKKLLCHQAFIDWKYCLNRDEDDNLPLHVAILNNDMDLVRRQCLVLKSRGASVDITTASGVTALQMSICQDSLPQCTSMLLQYGADPFLTDDNTKTCLHQAAEGATRHLRAVINYCTMNARQVLRNEEDIWNPKLENKSNEDLAQYLLTKMSVMCDEQGYTPLMLAAKVGNADNVKLLLNAAPSVVNMGMPNCGNTALYLTVSAACFDAIERGNRSNVSQKFSKTIEVLLENGACPSVVNHFNNNVNDLLADFSIPELSMLIANKFANVKYFDGAPPSGSKNFDSYMLLKDKEGDVKLKEIDKTTIKTEKFNESNIKKEIKILENVPVTVTKRNVTLTYRNARKELSQKINLVSPVVNPKNIVLKAGVSSTKMEVEKSEKCVKLSNNPIILHRKCEKTEQSVKPIVLKTEKSDTGQTNFSTDNKTIKIIINTSEKDRVDKPTTSARLVSQELNESASTKLQKRKPSGPLNLSIDENETTDAVKKKKI